MNILVHLLSQSQPIEISNVKNCYTKDGLFCVYHDDVVDKFPLVNIFRIREPYQYVTPASDLLKQKAKKTERAAI